MDKNLYVYVLRSRNKDNKDVPNFKERYRTILAYDEDETRIFEQFRNFAKEGLPGEKTRLYRSVNKRNEEKVLMGLLIRLIEEKPSVTKVNRILASVAQQKENAAEKKWLFDFDIDDEVLLDSFIKDIKACSSDIQISKKKTPNGFAIVTNHGFDTRELLKKYADYDITLKRDELLFLDMIENV